MWKNRRKTKMFFFFCFSLWENATLSELNYRKTNNKKFVAVAVVRQMKIFKLFSLSLIHEADPWPGPVVITIFAGNVLFKISQNKTNLKLRWWSLLTGLWVWPSGSLMAHRSRFCCIQKSAMTAIAFFRNQEKYIWAIILAALFFSWSHL